MIIITIQDLSMKNLSKYFQERLALTDFLQFQVNFTQEEKISHFKVKKVIVLCLESSNDVYMEFCDNLPDIV